jgi:glutamate decarboxylase
VVFRVVLANPLTTDQILLDVLEEQQQVAALDKEFLPRLLQMAKDSTA